MQVEYQTHQKKNKFIPNSVLPLSQRNNNKSSYPKNQAGSLKRTNTPKYNMNKNANQYYNQNTSNNYSNNSDIRLKYKNKKIRLLKNRIQYLISVNKSLLDQMDCSSKRKIRSKLSLIQKYESKKTKIDKLKEKIQKNKSLLDQLESSNSEENEEIKNEDEEVDENEDSISNN